MVGLSAASTLFESLNNLCWYFARYVRSASEKEKAVSWCKSLTMLMEIFMFILYVEKKLQNQSYRHLSPLSLIGEPPSGLVGQTMEI